MPSRPASRTVGLVATARPTFAVEPARAQLAAARDLLRELGAELIGPAEPLMTPDDVAAAHADVDLDADLLLHVCATFSDASPARELYRDARQPIVLWAFREPGQVGERLWWNSLCGANLMGHALVRDGHDVRLLYGDPDDPVTQDVLRRAIGGQLPPRPALPQPDEPRAPITVARDALERLRGRRIGALGEGPTGFTPSEFDADQLTELLGLEVAPHPLADMLTAIRDVPVHLRERERAGGDRVAAEHHAPRRRRGRPVRRHDGGPPGLARLRAPRCPRHPVLAGVPDRARRVPLLGALPTRRRARADAVRARRPRRGDHAAPRRPRSGSDLPGRHGRRRAVGQRRAVLALRSCRDAIGERPRRCHPVRAQQPQDRGGGQLRAPAGRVVATRLSDDPSRPGALRLLIAAGTVLDAPNRFQGNTADVRLDTDASEFVTALVTGGFPHHTVLTWVDVRPELRAVADELGIDVVEFA